MQEQVGVKYMRISAMVLGISGSIIAIWSAISALVTLGGEAPYSARLWAGWASLILAILAGGCAALIATRPRPASVTLLTSGIVGFACINLFYINTFYGLAVPLWVVGAILAWLAAKARSSEAKRREI